MLSVTVLGATAEEEAFFESEAPPFAKCADASYSASLRTATEDKDDLIVSCIVRAHRQSVADPTVALATGRQMVMYLREDPALAPRLSTMLEAAMNKYGVTTEFVNAILAPAVSAAPAAKSRLPWIVGAGILMMGVVGVVFAVRGRGHSDATADEEERE